MEKRICVALVTCLLSVASAWSQPFGMDPGMMRGYGMGYGMMDGYGRGPGMLEGYGWGNWGLRISTLTDEQRGKIEEVEKNYRQKQWQLIEKMHEFHFQSGCAYRDGKFDEQAARKNYEAMAGLRKQMFENSLEERKRIDSILAPQ